MTGALACNAARRGARALAALVAAFGLAGCSPEVGSDAWCKAQDAKPKGEWSANDAAAFAKHCVLGLKPDRTQ